MSIKTYNEIVDGKFLSLPDSSKSKLVNLLSIIGSFKAVCVAYSGGVDSAFLAYAASLVSSDVLLVTAVSETYPEFEQKEARDLAQKLGLRQIIIHTHELQITHYQNNPPDRCYYCKSELFRTVIDVANDHKCDAVFEGGNYDDLSDYRPGRRALKELEVLSPLCEAGLTKAEIRQASAAVGLPTASKPSYACLASRFPYGENLTAEKLKRVELAEDALRRLGFTQFRVRSHGDLARIELTEAEMDAGWHKRKAIAGVLKSAGFHYSTIDLQGYRTGAMNEVLGEGEKKV